MRLIAAEATEFCPGSCLENGPVNPAFDTIRLMRMSLFIRPRLIKLQITSQVLFYRSTLSTKGNSVRLADYAKLDFVFQWSWLKYWLLPVSKALHLSDKWGIKVKMTNTADSPCPPFTIWQRDVSATYPSKENYLCMHVFFMFISGTCFCFEFCLSRAHVMSIT